MANIIKQSFLNPVKFQLINPIEIPQYVSKHMDDWLFKNTQRSFEQTVNYKDIWSIQDPIRLQYISNFGPLNLKLFSCNGVEIYSIPFQTRQQDFFNPGYYIRQIELDLNSLSGLEEGYYYLTIPEAGWISEPFEVAEDVENTLFTEYSHSERYGGIIFDSPFSPAIRIKGILKYDQPSSIDTVYDDEEQSETMLRSIPFRVWKLIIGSKGIPPYLIDKLNRILGCDSLKIDGRFYTKAEGAKWEEVELDSYPMSGWAINLRETLNREETIYENEVEIIGKAAMMQVIDTKGFGIDDSGVDFLEISDIS